MTFVSTKYIWADPNAVVRILPKYLGWLWFASAEYIKVVPAVTHLAVNICNWKKIDESKPGYELDNLDVDYTTLSHDPEAEASEKWFYNVHNCFELNCGASLGTVRNILKLINQCDLSTLEKDARLIENMNDLSSTITIGKDIIARMKEGCDKDAFFFKLRNFLSGSSKIEGGLQLFNGSEYVTISYQGGSAAQSTLIQLWDLVIEVQHEHHAKEFLINMRNYMPLEHREVIEKYENNGSRPVGPTLSQYVGTCGNRDVQIAYNQCVDSLKKFRQVHYGLVHYYIVSFVSELKVMHAQVINTDAGTGGTDPVNFNRNTIAATGRATIPVTSDKSVQSSRPWILSPLSRLDGWRWFALLLSFNSIFAAASAIIMSATLATSSPDDAPFVRHYAGLVLATVYCMCVIWGGVFRQDPWNGRES
jgi:hypothetical protein